MRTISRSIKCQIYQFHLSIGDEWYRISRVAASPITSAGLLRFHHGTRRLLRVHPVRQTTVLHGTHHRLQSFVRHRCYEPNSSVRPEPFAWLQREARQGRRRFFRLRGDQRRCGRNRGPQRVRYDRYGGRSLQRRCGQRGSQSLPKRKPRKRRNQNQITIAGSLHSLLTTSETSFTSRPRAATSVATKTRSSPVRNCPIT